MYKYLTIAVLFLTIVACKKRQSAYPDMYAVGDLIVGIKGDAPLNVAFDLFNTNNLSIQQVYGFTYEVSQPEEQFDSIKAYLNTKPYVDSVNWSAEISYNYKSERYLYRPTFFDMDINDQEDWLQTAKDLNFTQLEDTLVMVALLRVPKGTEKYWAETLAEDPIIKWAELNAIFNIER